MGLANPGNKYASTRHNVGSWFVRRLANHYQNVWRKDSDVFGYTTQLLILGYHIWLLIPDTFMNRSGKSIDAIAKLYRIIPDQILVVHDDLNLPAGRAKFKRGGGSSGHNGLKNIRSYFSNFKRLRIGIGYPSDRNNITNYVLDTPSDLEMKLITSTIEEAIYCCTMISFKDGLMKAMSRLHSFNANNYVY